MRAAFVALLLALGGCLPEGRPVEGRLLFTGRAVEKPNFVNVDGAASVLYEVRTAPAQPPRAATYELWMVGYDGGAPQVMLANVADRDSWRPQVDGAGIRYVMIDERAVDGGSAVGAPSPVATA